MTQRSKYTPETIEQICKLLSDGNTDTTVCAAVKIDRGTFYGWIKDKPEFAEKVTEARSIADLRPAEVYKNAMVDREQTSHTVKEVIETRFDRSGQPYEYKKITKLATVTKVPADWRAAESWNERRHPEDWAKNRVIKVTEDDYALCLQYGATPQEAWDRYMLNLRKVKPEQATQLAQPKQPAQLVAKVEETAEA